MGFSYGQWQAPQGYGDVDVLAKLKEGLEFGRGLRDDAAAPDLIKKLYMEQGGGNMSLAALDPSGRMSANPTSRGPAGGQMLTSPQDALVNGSAAAAEGATDLGLAQQLGARFSPPDSGRVLVADNSPSAAITALYGGDQGGVPGLDAYMADVAQRESGGDPTAQNPNSSATGLYQFTRGTWGDVAQAHPELNLTPDGITDPGQQQKAMAAFTRDNARALKNAGIAPTPASLYAAHFLGIGAAPKVLTAADDTPMTALVSPEVIAANPNLRGMTAADFKAWVGGASRNSNGGYQAPTGGADGAWPTPNQRMPQVPRPSADLLAALAQNTVTRPLAMAIVKQNLDRGSVDQYQTFTGPDGGTYQVDLATNQITPLNPPKVASVTYRAITDPAERHSLGIPDTDKTPYQIGSDGKLSRVGGGGTNVTVNTGDGADAVLDKKLSEKEADSWNNAKDAAAVSGANGSDFGVLDQLIQIAPQGPITGRLAEAFPGFNNAGAAFQSIVKRVAPTLRAVGSGSTSDVEYNGFLQSMPALQNNPQANKAILEIMKAKAALNVQRGDIVTDYQNRKITVAEARSRMAALDRQSIITPELRQALEAIGATLPAGSGTSTSPGATTTLPDPMGFKH